MPPESKGAPWEVPADVAYRAAEERAVRTVRALILAEAQIAVLERRVAELEADGRAAAERELTLRARLSDVGEVEHDGPEGCADGAAAGGEAGQSHPVHD